MPPRRRPLSPNVRDAALLITLGLLRLAANAATNQGYGFHRDELATVDDARHLAWGYVAYPPATPFIGRLALELFGPEVLGFRFFSALAVTAATVVTGLMARELGAARAGQIVAMAAATI